MKRDASQRSRDTDHRLSGLIETLLETDAQIEALTLGEVDGEAVRQAAILNALPANIALLDQDGFIVSVNKSWQRFNESDLPHPVTTGTGHNYLTICDATTGDAASEAQQAAAGTRSVLSGTTTSFSMEYPCHSPLHERWFLLTVMPMAEHRQNGVIVMHLDITERKQVEQALHRYVGAMDAIADAIYLVDRESMSLIHANDAACRLSETTREELLTLTPWRVLATSREALEQAYDALIASGVDAEPSELLRHNKDGSPLWIELRRHAEQTDNRWTIVTLVRDVTERKENEHRISRLNRVHAMLSNINALIVRVNDRDELFRNACMIALDAGRFRMAWIGIVDCLGKKINPIASAGAEPEFLTIAKDSFPLEGDAHRDRTMSVRAVQERTALVLNELRDDSNILFAKTRLAQGIRSMAFLPLIIANEAVGVLTLYADEVGFFDEAEMKLLTELAGDIAFAIDHIDKQERLDYLAYYDVLTGLANRNLFLERMAQHMRSAAHNRQQLALFLFDLERFKNINDRMGRPVGDALLRLVATWITHKVGDVNLVGRVGPDPFAVVLPAVKVAAGITRLLKKAIEAFREHPFQLNGAVFRVGVKAGVAISPRDGTHADKLFNSAEAALTKAKSSGERYLVYTQTMNDAVSRNMTLKNQLRQALDREEFILHYQPKINLASGKIISAEALIRWDNPLRGIVPPSQFVPILEETGLIYEVGRWALHKAVADYLRWQETGLSAVRIAVNVSPLQLRHRRFIHEIEQAIHVNEHAANGLELEITESVIMEDIKRSIASLQAIRALNVRIAIDDFGTGFSSLSYLAKLPVDTLKIDQSFIKDMTNDRKGLALVGTVINLSHSLKLNVVAEGVETDEQHRLLRLLDCDEMQGFLFSRPVPVDVFEAKFLTSI